MSRLTEESGIGNSYILHPQPNTPSVIVEGMIYNKLGKLEDLIDEMDSVRIVERNGITSLHIDMILTGDTLPIVKEIFKDKLK